MKEVQLPSGAVLKTEPAPFAAAKALYQALLKEARSISIVDGNDLGEIVKNAFCAGFSSAEVEACLTECMKRCTYRMGPGHPDMKIDKDTFEPVDSRQDYLAVSTEVIKQNVGPFVKSLSSDFRSAIAMLGNIRK